MDGPFKLSLLKYMAPRGPKSPSVLFIDTDPFELIFHYTKNTIVWLIRSF